MAEPPLGRGWSRPGYTDLIHLDGRVENLYPYNSDDYVQEWELTYGARGYNSISRHIAYVGGISRYGKPKDTRTVAQLKTMSIYLKFMVMRHPKIKIVGHRDLPNVRKACPSFDVVSYLRAIGIPKENIYRK